MRRFLPGATSCSSCSDDSPPNNLSARSTLDFHPRIAESMSDFCVVIPLPAFHLDELHVLSRARSRREAALHHARASRRGWVPMIPPNNSETACQGSLPTHRGWE